MRARPRQLRDEALTRMLTAKGIRVTGQRLSILRELTKLRAPISHPELTDRLAGPTLDRATIYRNLLSLHEAGLLVRTHLGDNVWRFELPRVASQQHGLHPHFVCTACGDIACLPKGAVTLRGNAARAQVSEVQLRGRCEDCARG